MKVCMLGTDFLSSNLGCGALGYSAIQILGTICKEKGEKLQIYGMVHTLGEMAIADPNISVSLIKLEPKKVSFWKKIISAFRQSDFIIDFTGGDSFSDLYGKKRFYIFTVIKQIAVSSGTPFILGPQTIGPFESWGAKKFAGHILRKCKYCWTRDRLSQEYTEKLCGRMPLLTTDVAFALPVIQKETLKSDKKKIGFNPSGLLWNKNESFEADKRICVNYREYVTKVMNALTQNPQYDVYLLPHVFDRNNTFGENDLAVCMEIHKQFPGTRIIADYNSPMEAKGIIGQMDVFIGARMHATIASFSSGVATIPFSYSRKFEGLYSDLDYPYLISGEKMSTEEAVEKTLSWIDNESVLHNKAVLAQPFIQSKQTEFYKMLKKL